MNSSAKGRNYLILPTLSQDIEVEFQAFLILRKLI